MVVQESCDGGRMVHKINNYAMIAKIDTVGAELISLKDRVGREYIWQGHPDSWGGHSPILFPICGSLRNDQAQLSNGKTASLPRHGFARKLPFTCDFSGDGKAQFTLSSTQDTLKSYPFPFSLTVQHVLSGGSICTSYRVTNIGTEDMPFFIGGHPGFCCPMEEACHYNDYLLEFEHEESCSIPESITATGLIDIGSRRELLKRSKSLPISHELFDQDAIILDNIRSRRVKLIHKDRTHGVELEFYDFPYLILWSNNSGDFVAIEPWTGLSTCSDEDDQFEKKRNVMILPPGESKTYSYRITLL